MNATAKLFTFCLFAAIILIGYQFAASVVNPAVQQLTVVAFGK